MTTPTTYLFYDLETSGLNPAFDQILQFAAIRTDPDFQEIARHEFRIRLRPDIIPAPGALLATNVSVLQVLTSGLTEYEAVRRIHALVNQPGTISIGYNSLGFDDLFLRFAFYRNLLPAYTHQWQNGCFRLDLFPITVFYWLQNSPLLVWPDLDNGPTLKLEYLSQANQLAEGPAHDALVDVAATVALARRLRQDEALWQDCLSLFDKTKTADQLEQLPLYLERPSALLIHSRFGYNQFCQVPALYLGQSELAGTRHLWLRLDKPELTQTTTDLNNLDDTTWVIRQKPGEPPFIRPPRPHKLSEDRQAIVQTNMTWLRDRPHLLEAISTHYRNAPFPNDFRPDADAALYANGFMSPQMEALCRQFHQADIADKLRLVRKIQDETVRELAVRLLCRNYQLDYRFPTYSAYREQIVAEERPLLDYRGRPRLTPMQALAEIEAARQTELAVSQRVILNDLERYIHYHIGLVGDPG